MDVTLVHRQGQDTGSEVEKEHANSSSLALYA